MSLSVPVKAVKIPKIQKNKNVPKIHQLT
jgi:hypothetical protein